ncbi:MULTISPECIES: Bug family tripartite tricarboxylate transporter substrate binding protein [Variovorax]|jgi:tripartite-type tricarboxylate transporter receptor subunit TctC|uniref:Tripartite tricarboxylate transporter substrate binding protein n=1 Tax=Variovorax ginsengisoli TaxID=363844 RepID=A0ABT8S5N9_9BURK|nr:MULTISPECIES: tripartite tricarboxylate transporter substrate binding protein [Variovorax]MDM0085349.1 tripartite tricarboxylate transporter substrate binding protein [Variovorax sp. J31P179]MDN8615067.1 tripartite tricarboxylate transporter substrate binding protein [Variovorax ginsengisoli]MDO1534237.1 tripartite tricarboxylate transporter substrate binding protein [Variovorax ginsengisoli]
MTIQRRQLLKLGAVAAASGALGSHAWAQAFPSRPVTLVVPFAPGGNTDIVARTVAVALGKVLGQSVIVDNRAGAGGSIGAAQVARAAPDGYTLLLCGAGVVVTVPEMVKTSYGRTNFAPLGLVNKSSMVLLARKDETRFKNFKEFAAYARSGEGKLTAAHSGPGTPNHLALLQLESLLKTKFTIVSYKGSGPALIDLIGGQIDVHFDQVPSALQHIKGGALQALAVLGPTQDPLLPGVQTVSELGFGSIDGTTYVGVLAPSGTPKDVQDKLAAALAQAVKDPQTVNSARELGSVALSSTPQEFGRILEAEYALAAQATKDGRLKVD